MLALLVILIVVLVLFPQLGVPIHPLFTQIIGLIVGLVLLFIILGALGVGGVPAWNWPFR